MLNFRLSYFWMRQEESGAFNASDTQLLCKSINYNVQDNSPLIFNNTWWRPVRWSSLVCLLRRMLNEDFISYVNPYESAAIKLEVLSSPSVFSFPDYGCVTCRCLKCVGGPGDVHPYNASEKNGVQDYSCHQFSFNGLFILPQSTAMLFLLQSSTDIFKVTGLLNCLTACITSFCRPTHKTFYYTLIHYFHFFIPLKNSLWNKLSFFFLSFSTILIFRKGQYDDCSWTKMTLNFFFVVRLLHFEGGGGIHWTLFSKYV